jgi:hypothetical protein
MCLVVAGVVVVRAVVVRLVVAAGGATGPSKVAEFCFLIKVLIIYLVLKLLLESICLPFRIERVALNL